MHSNPCGRGNTGIPIDLARGGGHHECVKKLEQAMGGGQHQSSENSSKPTLVTVKGREFKIRLVQQPELNWEIAYHK
jgi:hypothetical protein